MKFYSKNPIYIRIKTLKNNKITKKGLSVHVAKQKTNKPLIPIDRMEYSNLANSNENGKKPAVYLTVDELTHLFSSVIESKLRDFKPTIPLPVKKEESHLNYAQAVAFLQISKPTFTKLRKSGKIKALRVGERRVLFNRTDLEAYLQSTHE